MADPATLPGRKEILLGWLRIVSGLLIFSFGIHLTILAGIGLAPWECLGTGISLHTPLNYGMSVTCMSVLMLAVDLLLGERIGFGTVLNTFLVGTFTQMFLDLNPYQKPESYLFSVLLILAGLTVMAFGQYIYIGSGQGCGPRDALLIGIGKRMKKVPIGFVQTGIYVLVLLAGFLLGGPVGLGTLLTVFGSGPIMQAIFKFLHFEPRSVTQYSIRDLFPILIRS